MGRDTTPPVPSSPSMRPLARYDAAKTDATNERYWINADTLPANLANSLDVRQKLFTRARYERKNNSYAKGLVETLAHDTIGTGPRPQVSLLDRPTNYARIIERAWCAWTLDRNVDLMDKLRLMDEAEVVDGESFALIRNNGGIEHPVKLSLQVIECEQCADPTWTGFAVRPGEIDGIIHDQWGNPAFYKILREHPGDTAWQLTGEYDVVEAKNVLHWFRPSRAGEGRGVSGLTAALDRFAQLRRFEKAVLTAAETAAVISAIMKTNMIPDGTGDEEDVLTYDKIPMEPGTMLTLPENWEATQLKPEQPTTTFRDFKGENLDAAGRCINAPSNVVRGHSREYNFASGRLDYVIWHRAIRIRRRRMRVRILDPLFRAFVDEAMMVGGVIPADLPPFAQWSWNWHWDGFESIDPVQDATAAQMRLQTGLTTYSELYAEQGKDWEEAFDQIAAEMEAARERGIPLAYGIPAAASALTTQQQPINESTPTDTSVEDAVDA